MCPEVLNLLNDSVFCYGEFRYIDETSLKMFGVRQENNILRVTGCGDGRCMGWSWLRIV
jgi:hypothetical protein